MPYIKSKEHFFNYLRKVLDEKLSANKIASLKVNKEEYELLVDKIYDLGLAERFTWELKSNTNLAASLENMEQFILSFVENNTPSFPSFEKRFYPFRDEFRDILTHLNGPGCFLFSNDGNKYLHIGMSQNIGSGATSDYGKLKLSTIGELYFEYYQTATRSDAAILENYLIATRRPMLNHHMKYDAIPTIELQNKPKISHRIKVHNTAEQEKNHEN